MIRYTAEGTQAQFDKLVRYLENYPKILDKHTYPGMKKTVDGAHKFIYPRIPIKSGASRGAFFKEVLGFGKTLTGVVGFRGGKGAPYHINIVEHGARSHSLVSKSRSRSASQRARYEKRKEKGKLTSQHFMVNGRWVTKADHPGFSKRGFMAAGFSASQPIFNHEMQAAADAAFNEVNS